MLLASELYHRERGTLPPSEDALVGTYLESLPDDGSAELGDETTPTVIGFRKLGPAIAEVMLSAASTAIALRPRARLTPSFAGGRRDDRSSWTRHISSPSRAPRRERLSTHREPFVSSSSCHLPR